MQPLDGIKALEFGGTILVSLATLVLAEAGADMVKVEVPSAQPLRACATA
ncbi:MAG TPA: CoA transferase [Alphaproteobacteria bacterium]|nr:CoA transferase [Alphaproteobacteria bacterium]